MHNKIKNKHSVAVRWMHWINFPILMIMIWSGILIYWANQAYEISIGNTVLFQFFPDRFYAFIKGSYSLAKGMSFHFAFLWLFILNGIFYILYLIFSKEWKSIFPEKKSFKEAWKVVLYDLKIKKTKPSQKKYNGAQRIAYTGVILLGAIVTLSGFAIYKPVQLHNLVAFFGGYNTARLIHFIATMLIVAFFIIHLIQVILAGWANFAAMVRGFDIDKNLKTKQAVVFKNLKSRSRKSFLKFGVFSVIGLLLITSIFYQPKDKGAYKPLRSMLSVNEFIFSKFLYSNENLTKTYSIDKAEKTARVNGRIGMTSDLDYDNWRLIIIKTNGDSLKISLDEIKKIPKKDLIFDFKCIEGWDQVTQWSGVTFDQFIKYFHLENEAKMNFVGLESTDKEYYVGIDMESMLHPQTILCYESYGKPLPIDQGRPLRLIIPVKYGVKHIKRIGEINFNNERPRDYWYERGYDYYTGL